MKEPLRIVPYEHDNPMAYPPVPEFTPGSHIIYGGQGTFAVENGLKILASDGFEACSGFIIRGEAQKGFGLLHALPGQDWYEAYFEKLRILAGGQVLLVEGSRSTPKSWILRDLYRRLGIEHVDTLSLDTRRPGVGNMHFHIALKPGENELFVARNSHKDLQIYRAFE